MRQGENDEACVLCGHARPLTAHHLIPKTLHSNKWFKKRFSDEDLLRTIPVCRPCHDAIHEFLDEKSLGREFNTLDKLLAHPKLAGYVRWARKH